MDLQETLRLGQGFLDLHLFTISGTRVTVATVVSILLILLATLWISRLAQRGVGRLLRFGGVTDRGSQGLAKSLVHYAVLAVGVGVALHTAGINLATLFAAGAIFAVGVGFATQNVFENFASGLILMGERSIKPGDILEVEGRMVEVQHMGFRSTIVRNRDEEELIRPNSILVQSTVKSFTLRDRTYRLRSVVGVLYSSDMSEVRQALERAAAEIAWRRPDREPVVLLREFADSAVTWEVSVWVDDPWRREANRSQLNEAIWWALKDRGIVIAFPQLDVHFDPPVTESLAALRSPA
ncbi:MAG: mechanosensitive ion channel family protein [Acidobacteriota bacterium]